MDNMSYGYQLPYKTRPIVEINDAYDLFTSLFISSYYFTANHVRFRWWLRFLLHHFVSSRYRTIVRIEVQS